MNRIRSRIEEQERSHFYKEESIFISHLIWIE